MDYLHSIARLKTYATDPLHRNALFLMAANVLSALFGFAFWALAARSYSSEEVGLATALISAVMLLVTISRLGFDYGIIRLLPDSENKQALINSCLTVSGLFSVVAASVFILGLPIWSPKLLFMRENWVYLLAFILSAGTATVSLLQGQVFTASRSAHFALVLSIVGGSKLLFVALLVGAGAMGIFAAQGLALGLTVVTGFLFTTLLYRKYRPRPMLDRVVLREMARFSLGNYLAGMFGALPQHVLPLIIIAVLTTESSAYFYIPFSIAGILGMVVGSTSFSLLAEGSHDPSSLRRQVIKAAKFMLLFIVPGIIILVVFGEPILSLFGADYAQNSLWLLRLFAISWLPYAVFALYATILRVQNKVKALIYLWVFTSVFTLAGSYLLMTWLGLIGIGIAFLSAQVIVAMMTGPMILRMAGIPLRSLVWRQ